jgi:hypothetical protein
MSFDNRPGCDTRIPEGELEALQWNGKLHSAGVVDQPGDRRPRCFDLELIPPLRHLAFDAFAALDDPFQCRG